MVKSSAIYWKGTKVFTPEHLINFFGLSADELGQIFKDHRADFILNEDYYKLSGQDAYVLKNKLDKDDKLQRLTFIFLFKESGVQKFIAFRNEGK